MQIPYASYEFKVYPSAHSLVGAKAQPTNISWSAFDSKLQNAADQHNIDIFCFQQISFQAVKRILCGFSNFSSRKFPISRLLLAPTHDCRMPKITKTGTLACVDWISSHTLGKACCSTLLGSICCTFSYVRLDQPLHLPPPRLMQRGSFWV